MAQDNVFVRIIPFDPQRGFFVKRYNYRGFTFKSDSGWYSVPAELGAELKKCVQDANSPDPKPVFEVGNEKEALEIARKEFEKQNPEVKIQSAIANAHVVTPRKIDKNDMKKPGSDEDEQESDDIPFR